MGWRRGGVGRWVGLVAVAPFRKPPGLRSYVSFNDDMLDHRRWAELSHADQDKALPFLIRAVMHCHRADTNGFVPSAAFLRVFGREHVQKRGWKLCWQIGVFEPDPRGLIVRDYLDYHPSSEERRSRSQTAIELNRKRWEERSDNGTAAASEIGSANGTAIASDTGLPGIGTGKETPPHPPLWKTRRRRSLTPDEIRSGAHRQEHP